MSEENKKVRVYMLKTSKGSDNGFEVQDFKMGQEYEIGHSLCRQFLIMGVAKCLQPELLAKLEGGETYEDVELAPGKYRLKMPDQSIKEVEVKAGQYLRLPRGTSIVGDSSGALNKDEPKLVLDKEPENVDNSDGEASESAEKPSHPRVKRKRASSSGRRKKPVEDNGDE